MSNHLYNILCSTAILFCAIMGYLYNDNMGYVWACIFTLALAASIYVVWRDELNWNKGETDE